MNSKMQVLYIKHTGHILSAFTRTADPEGKPSFLPANEADLRSLLVRDPKGFNSVLNASIAFNVPATLVEQAVVDFKAEVFSTPLTYMVTAPGASAVGVNAYTIPSLTTNSIEVESTLEVFEDTKVWVQLEQANPISGDDPIRRVMEGEIKKKDLPNGLNGKKTTLLLKSRPGDVNPAPIPTEDFFILALVAGREALFHKKTAT